MNENGNTPVWERNYDGLTIKSDYRAHEKAFELFDKLMEKQSKRVVLDIATGTGAFTKRMMDHYPENEYIINDFESQSKVFDAKTHKVDLNENFSQEFGLENFDIVVALEIIEHLENPWNFLGEIKKILKPNGVLILSTPNSDSMLDRINYLIYGFPLYFGERGYENSGGHITPVPDWLFKKIAETKKYKAVELIGDIDTKPLTGLGMKIKILICQMFFWPFFKFKNNRAVNLYLCRG
jgi:ubiquinone/menaquinone biosynthesis C-methylase UbiE